uniref:Universal stress protein Slr1101 (Trinotate prediction) n=1 Tax=Myxobolus squamalis TaxID=59785 RepID=A0A6B2G6Z6_MYXSQ
MKKDDELIIVHVYQPPVLPGLSISASPGNLLTGSYFSEIENTVDKAKTLLLKFKKLAEENDIVPMLILRATEGNIGQTICSIASELKPSMIIVGSRGLGAVSRFLLGSVSDYVLHHAESTICIVPHP